MSGIGFGLNDANSFSSTLSGTATSTLDSTLVECFGPDANIDTENMIGNSTLQILGQQISSILLLVLYYQIHMSYETVSLTITQPVSRGLVNDRL